MDDPIDCMLLLRRWHESGVDLFLSCANAPDIITLQLYGGLTELDGVLRFSTRHWPLISVDVPLLGSSLQLLDVDSVNAELAGKAPAFDMAVAIEFESGETLRCVLASFKGWDPDPA